MFEQADSDFVDTSAEVVETSSEEGSVSDQLEDQQEDATEGVDEAETSEEEVEADGEAEDGETEEGSEPELVEVEYDGQTYTVPPELKDAMMRESDYSKKTAEVAEQRRDFEAEKADFQKFVAASKTQADALADLKAIDRQLSEYQQVDWNLAFDQDPGQAGKLKHQYDTLIMQRQATAQKVQQAHAEQDRLQGENLARQAAKTDQLMSEKLPGWGDELKQQLGDFAVEQMGFPVEAVKKAVTPGEIETLYWAKLGFENYQKQQQQAAKATKPKPAKPVAKLKPKRQTRQKSPDEMSDTEWLEWRNADLKRKGRH